MNTLKPLLLPLLFGFTALTLASTESPLQPEAYGIAAKRPVFAGACHYCPYGAIAEVVRAAMKPYGYDVQICYSCATTVGTRQVVAKIVPPPPAGAAIRSE